ncbi:hypothetical protein J2W40_000033 [Sphingobium xenophagum]|uniref:Uncharacterized protein n=1 Tax=Sphingobium xenophagum TaxID=121428 RepID=A0ABU1WVN3_SPHXE|nr:hypothetical protein [Sphingobium xenophagum]
MASAKPSALQSVTRPGGGTLPDAGALPSAERRL